MLKHIIIPLLFCYWTLPVFAADENQKVILNISSYHDGYGWTDDCVAGITEGVGSNHKLINHYMDTKRIKKEDFKKAANQALTAYNKIKPDLVLIGDDNALLLLGGTIANNNTPVVYYGINGNPRLYFYGSIPKHVTGVLERVPIIPMMRVLGVLLKHNINQKVTILSDGSTTSAAFFTNSFKGDRKKQVNTLKGTSI